MTEDRRPPEGGDPHPTDQDTATRPAGSDESNRIPDGLPTRTEHGAPTGLPAGVPESIGPYRVLSQLGSGGMGVVYEAEQQRPRRRVAIKVVRGGQFVDEHQVKLFQREADTLARLKHPNIAAIHESGCTEDGQHFFAMELVRGQTLDEFMKGRPDELTGEELKFRLALFRKIADAVHYAHQRGVIHRDLKPSNIVVTEEATREDDVSTSGSSRSGLRVSEIKILDFGLARITEEDVTATTMTTEVGIIKGTLPYMSPEQAQGNSDEIDVRTDIYALGVVLYEMLAGRRPYDVLKKSIAEAVRVISEESPLPLTSAPSEMRKKNADIETIVGKALEKEPERRYSTAAELSEDIRRYQTSLPILARPPSAVYQIKKFAARNRAVVGGAVATLIVLAAGTVVSTAGMVRATRAEGQAREEAETASQVSGFLVDLFEISDPNEARGNSVTAREILDRGVEKIDTELQDQPDVQERLMKTMGLVYRRLGLREPTTELFEKIAFQRQRRLGDEHPDTLTALCDLAAMYRDQSRYDEAERLYLDTLEARSRALGEDHRDTLFTKKALGVLYKRLGRHDDAVALGSEALEGYRRTLGDEHRATRSAMNDLAIFYWYQGRWDEAEALHLEYLETTRKVLGGDDPSTIFATSQLAKTYYRRQQYDKATEMFEEALAARRRTMGDDYTGTLNSMRSLGQVYEQLGRLEKAEALYLEEVAGRTRVQGPEHGMRLDSMTNLSLVWIKQGRLDEAEAMLVEILETRRAGIGNEPQETLGSMGYLAYCYRKQGRTEEAERLLLEKIDTGRRAHGDRHPRVLEARNSLIELYLEAGRADDARPLVAEQLADQGALAGRPDAGARAKNAYAWLALTCEPADLRDPDSALRFALEANDLTEHQNAGYLDTLALAYHLTGSRELAVETQRAALSRLPDGGSEERIEFEQRLAEYEGTIGATLE